MFVYKETYLEDLGNKTIDKKASQSNFNVDLIVECNTIKLLVYKTSNVKPPEMAKCALTNETLTVIKNILQPYFFYIQSTKKTYKVIKYIRVNRKNIQDLAIVIENSNSLVHI